LTSGQSLLAEWSKSLTAAFQVVKGLTAAIQVVKARREPLGHLLAEWLKV
jgi:hypothetical protein